MKKYRYHSVLFAFIFTLSEWSVFGAIREKFESTRDAASSSSGDPAQASEMDAEASAESQDLERTKEALKSLEGEEDLAAAKPEKKTAKKRINRAEAFVAGADWEFDGFVTGGQDQNVKSMFVLNDLLYLNIGSSQGLVPGERLGIYKRGERIRDVQSGKFIGFEVRHAAIAEVTNRLSEETAVVRVLKTFEPVGLGDLVLRAE